jgi:hypothetical protein
MVDLIISNWQFLVIIISFFVIWKKVEKKSHKSTLEQEGVSTEKIILNLRLGKTKFLDLPNHLINNKAIAIEAIKVDPKSYLDLYYELRNDFDVAFAYVNMAINEYKKGVNKNNQNEPAASIENLKDNVRRYIDTIYLESKLCLVSPNLLSNKPFILTVINHCEDSHILKFASESIKADKSIVLEGIKYGPTLLEYLSKELRDDSEVVRRVAWQTGSCMKYASDRLKDDKDLFLDLFENTFGTPGAFQFASDRLKSDEDVILKGIVYNKDVWGHVPEQLRCNKEFLIKAIEINYVAFYFNPLLKDIDFVFEAIKINGNAFKCLPIDFQNDKSFVLEMLKHNESIYEHLPDNLKTDKEIILEALPNSSESIKQMNDDLKSDRQFMLKVLMKNGASLEFVPDKLKEDREIVLAAVKEGGAALKYVPDKFKEDREILLAAVKNGGAALKYVPDKFKEDREVVLEALKNSMWLWSFSNVPENLKNDKDFIIKAVKVNCFLLEFVYFKFKIDFDVVSEAASQNIEVLKFVPSWVRNNNEILKILNKNST